MLNLVSLRQAIVKTLAETFSKKFDRNQLVDGSKHCVAGTVRVEGTVDGVPFACDMPLDSTITAGHATTKASSWTPEAESQLAYALELIDLAFGDNASSEIVADIRKKFSESGTVEASDRYSEMVANLAASMRQTKQVSANGPVSVKQLANAGDVSITIADGVAA
jgi:hypothetical protein